MVSWFTPLKSKQSTAHPKTPDILLPCSDKGEPRKALHVQLIAHTLERAACKQAMWMTACHVGQLVRYLTDVNYKLQVCNWLTD